MIEDSLPKRVLTIAGSDSGGGAGIQADLKTILALGGYGMSAITAVTAQNSRGVSGVEEMPAGFVAQQIDDVASDLGADAAKTGMLSNAGVVAAVAEAIARNRIPHLVVDPVMVAKSGDALLHESAVGAVVKNLLPLAEVVTPNAPEAAILSGRPVQSLSEAREAAKGIAGLGPKYVLLKGGHLSGDTLVDLLYDGSDFTEFAGPRIHTQNTHGTGCTLSAALATLLAQGKGIVPAVKAARAYLLEAMRRALPFGSGHGPLNHGWPLGRGA